MSLMGLVNASFSHGANSLFENVTFHINQGDRIGLVGINGSGKTSFLQCLLGNEELNEGKRTGGNIKIGYLEQDLPTALETLTLYELLEQAIPEDERSWSGYKVDMTLNALGAPEDIWFTEACKLSGGWRRLAMIARLALAEPEILLLDEPTNHLDLEKILRLEEWLKAQDAACILVSHDRAFLDHCTSRTAFLRGGKLIVYDLPYSSAAEQLYEDDLAKAKQRELEEAEIERIRRSAKRLRVWSRGLNDKMDRKVKAMNRRADRLEAEVTEVHREQARNLELRDSGINSSRAVLRVSDFDVTKPDGTFLFRVDNLAIMPGDRVAILGRNGTGKSRFINAVVNAQSPGQNPHIRFQPQTKVGYVDQAQVTLAGDQRQKLVDVLPSMFTMSPPQVVKELVHAGFPVREHGLRVAELSFGQRTRLGFLVLKLRAPNFFILDEPTNHLDIDGQDSLEDEVLKNDSSAIIVSHDRALVGSLANRFFVIDPKKHKLVEIDSPELFYASLR